MPLSHHLQIPKRRYVPDPVKLNYNVHSNMAQTVWTLNFPRPLFTPMSSVMRIAEEGVFIAGVSKCTLKRWRAFTMPAPQTAPV